MKQFIQKLRLADTLILDTETTGLDNRAEVVQIALVDLDGDELFNSLVRPARARRWPEATRVHGITWSHVKGAPDMVQLAEDLQRLVDGRQVAVYNAAFDRRLLRQSIKSARAEALYPWLFDQDSNWQCVMEAYAAHWGERDRRYGGYRWQSLTSACRQQGVPLQDAHSALGDARLTAALLSQIEKKLA